MLRTPFENKAELIEAVHSCMCCFWLQLNATQTVLSSGVRDIITVLDTLTEYGCE